MGAKYCSNCFNQPFCINTHKVAEFEALADKFTEDNSPSPVRLSITNVGFNCKNKDQTGPT